MHSATLSKVRKRRCGDGGAGVQKPTFFVQILVMDTQYTNVIKLWTHNDVQMTLIILQLADYTTHTDGWGPIEVSPLGLVYRY